MLFLTTEKNSYGVVDNRWWDGKASPFYLLAGGFQLIQILNVRRYEYLEGTCKDESYYECIGSNIPGEEKCKENGWSCAPISLPSKERKSDYRICQSTNISHQCGFFLQSQQEKCMGQKPCYVQEYSMYENSFLSGRNKILLNTIMNRWFNGNTTEMETPANEKVQWYMFSLVFGYPSWTRGTYTKHFQKEVHKECLVWSSTSLVGNIGGYMGLCVGFSFTGFIAWILGIIPKMCKALSTITDCNARIQTKTLY